MSLHTPRILYALATALSLLWLLGLLTSRLLGGYIHLLLVLSILLILVSLVYEEKRS